MRLISKLRRALRRLLRRAPDCYCLLKEAAGLYIAFELVKMSLELPDKMGLARCPRDDMDVEGEVCDNIILVYSPDLASAVRTLVHEAVEYLIHHLGLAYKAAGIIEAKLGEDKESEDSALRVRNQIRDQIYQLRESVMRRIEVLTVGVGGLLHRIANSGSTTHDKRVQLEAIPIPLTELGEGILLNRIIIRLPPP